MYSPFLCQGVFTNDTPVQHRRLSSNKTSHATNLFRGLYLNFRLTLFPPIVHVRGYSVFSPNFLCTPISKANDPRVLFVLSVASLSTIRVFRCDGFYTIYEAIVGSRRFCQGLLSRY